MGVAVVIAILIVGYFAALWLGLFGPYESPHRLLRTRTTLNARDIATALLQYASDYDDRLPSSFDGESSLRLILSWQGITTFPKTLNPNGGTFIPNANLAGANLAELEDASRTVLVYETMPWPDGRRPIYSFADGSAGTGGRYEELIWTVKP